MRPMPSCLPPGLVLALLLAASPAPAQDGGSPYRYQPWAEIFVSTLFADSVTEGSLGLRGGLRIRDRFHLEGSLSRLDDDRVDLFLLDLSAKYYLRDRRTDFYLVAGPGLFYSSDLGADELMLHLGFGAEFALGERLYLRPEIRGRWFAEDLGASTTGDLSLGLGWRF